MEKKNILIDYTKWLLKWLLIIAVALSTAMGVFVLYEQEIDMIALSCGGSGADPFLYLLKKERDKDAPSSIYTGAYMTDNFTKGTGYKELRKIAGFIKIEDNSYIFRDIENRNIFRELNRINLEMNFRSRSGKITYAPKRSCKVIDVDEFYAIVEEETKKRQDKMKI